MPTADSVKTKIQGLINSANAATGQTDGNLSAAVASLVAGFGGSGGAHCGTYFTSERVIETLEFPTPGGATNFAFFLYDEPVLDSGNGFCITLVASKDGRVIGAASNNTGTTANVCVCYENKETTNGYYYGVKFNADSVTMLAPGTSAKYTRAPLANKTYVWTAW